MPSLPANEYVEIREGSHYYIVGTRIGLDVLVYAYRRGKTPEALLEAYPSIGSLAKVNGAIAFILEHPQEVEAYLREQDALWEKFCEEHPIPDDMLERFIAVSVLPLCDAFILDHPQEAGWQLGMSYSLRDYRTSQLSV